MAPFILSARLLKIPFALNNAMLSRARVYVLNSLTNEDLLVVLAHTIAYLACAPKSNAVYMAYNAAMRDAKQSGSLGVPVHLRNAPTKLMKSLSYGKEYRYAHNEPEAYAAG
jgi:replication-associated recombination protein RarA